MTQGGSFVDWVFHVEKVFLGICGRVIRVSKAADAKAKTEADAWRRSLLASGN